MGENAALILPPYFGKDHLLNYLRERRSDRERIFGTKLPEYIWAYGTIRPAEKVETAEWLEQMAYSVPGYSKRIRTLESFLTLLDTAVSEETSHLVFVINISEELKLSALMRFFALANRTIYAIPGRIHFILALYQQWDDDEFRSASALYNSLLQHAYRPRHRTDEEIQHFIRYRLNVWNHTLPDDAIAQITRDAGGIPLFAKAAVRIASREGIKNTPGILRILYHHPEYIERIRLYVASFTDKQRAVLECISRRDNQCPTLDVEHMFQKRIVELNPDGNGYHIRSQALHRVLTGHSDISIQTLLSDIPLTPLEHKCLTCLSASEELVVSRKSLAEYIWENGVEYSDWALDKLISRLRKKLTAAPVGKSIAIVSEKRKGITLHRI